MDVFYLWSKEKEHNYEKHTDSFLYPCIPRNWNLPNKIYIFSYLILV